MKKELAIFFLSAAQIIAVLLFCAGFFPTKSPIPGNGIFETFDNELNLKISAESANLNTNSDCLKSLLSTFKRPKIEKLVFVVIDALRTDFLLDSAGSSMKFIRKLIDNRSALAFSARTQSPTVTMPRIKAITAGTVPAFVDVVLNLMTSEFVEDNWVEQLKRRNRSIAFFGDDTWTRLFPSHFHKIDPTTSFFVSDYTEVDDNVTRNLDWALDNNSNWDVMILHYLGLDHIGHSFGPKSPLVPKKLAEMDEILERIYKFLSENNLGKSMIVVLGDHGMSDIGSHGGASLAETGVPLAFLSPDWSKDFDTKNLQSAKFPEIQQIDLVPTLAALLAIPVPQNNLGILIPEVLHRITEQNSLSSELVPLGALENAMQIQNVNLKNRKISDTDDRLELLIKKQIEGIIHICENNGKGSETAKNLTAELLAQATETRDGLMTSFVEYNIGFMLCGTFLSLLVLLVLCVRLVPQMSELFSSRESSSVFFFLLLGTVIHSASYGSSSFLEEEHQTWYFLWASFLLVVLANDTKSSWLSRKNQESSKLELPKTRILVLLCLHRVLRAWDQTGVKWTHLPDIGDWLNRQENSGWKAAAILISAVAVLLVALFCSSNKGRTFVSKFLFLCGFVCVIWFHWTRGNFEVPGISISTHGALLQARLVFLSAFLLCIFERKLSESGLLLLACLLIRAQDFPVVFGILLTAGMTSRLYRDPLGSCSTGNTSPFVRSLAVYWLTMVSYFYLGNSNSLGSINVSVGYVGLDAYVPTIVGVLMLFHMYTGPILVVLHACSPNDPVDLFAILLVRALPTSIYLILVILQRYHLFVWSVFAPKLLYEAVHTVILNGCVWFIVVRSYFQRKK